LRLSQFNYFGPRNFSILASYYTETLLYSNFRGPLFSRTCQAREIREIKGRENAGFIVLFLLNVFTVLVHALKRPI